MDIQFMSQQARDVINFGRERHWRFRPMDVKGRLSTPAIIDDWLFIPIEDNASIIPEHALARVKALESAGFKTNGLIIAHEAPKVLAAPKPKPKKDATKGNVLADLIRGALEVFGYALLFSTMVLIDPALIVVLEDGTWLEVMTWYE